MKLINNVTRDEERAFYGSRDTHFDCVTISGPQDGESAFKECHNILITNSNLFLRYPCWHDTDTKLINCVLNEFSRAGFWYDDNISFENVNCHGVKALRESKNITINNSKFISPEFAWRCHQIKLNNSEVESEYAFFESENIEINNMTFKGKYSFQYVKNLVIKHSYLDTKDAFWHAEHVVITDSVVKGEYLAWYANDITFINCRIIGTQPICYAKNVKFKDCTFEKADFAFEYSEVNGNILGTMISIKNPLSGVIEIDKIPTMIIDEFDRSNGKFKIVEKK